MSIDLNFKEYYHWTRVNTDVDEIEEYVIEVSKNKIKKTPIIYPEDVDKIHVEIICPYCRTRHRHGSNNDGNYGGHRLAHCTTMAVRRNKRYNTLIGLHQENGYYIRDLKIKDLSKSIGVKLTDPLPFSGIIYNLGTGQLVNLVGYNHGDNYLDEYGALEMD